MAKQKKRGKNNLMIILVITIILFIIAALIFLLPLISQKKYVLATINSDPRDYSKGQYMDIIYEINNLHLEKLSNSDAGKDIYVHLKPDSNNIWRFNGYGFEKPKDIDFIKGKIMNIENFRINIIYGIEKYPIEKDKKIDGKNIMVEAKVSSSGQARIVKLIQNGKLV